MTRIIIMIAIAAIAGAFWVGMKWDAKSDYRERIETEERANEADPDFTNCAWHDRLRGECE